MVDQLSSLMEAKRKKAILNCFKWLAFVLCSSAFLWKTSDSIINYMDNDIGTKIILKRNFEADLPAFAICIRFFFNLNVLLDIVRIRICSTNGKLIDAIFIIKQ